MPRSNESHQAHRLCREAVLRGQLVPPDHCEVCGVTRGQWEARGWIKALGRTFKVYGHHWKGYNYPLDVWWVCPPCNWKLRNRHDGSLSIEEARKMVGPPDLFDVTDDFIHKIIG